MISNRLGFIMQSVGPSLDIDFTQGIDSALTFSRNSIATYFDSNGVMQTATVNATRLDYNPVTLQPLGLKIEPETDNLLTYSNNFSHSNWNKGSSISLVSSDSVSSPIGTITGATISVNSSKQFTYIRQTPLLTKGVTYTASLFVKRTNHNFVGLRIFSSGDHCAFNLTTLSWSGFNLSSYSSYGFQQIGNGWYRIWVTRTITEDTGNGIVGFCICDANGNETPNLTGSETLNVFGFQLESGSYPTSYIPTLATSVVRRPDYARLLNLPGWYNQMQGTILVEFIHYLNLTNKAVFSFNSGNSNNRIELRNVGIVYITSDSNNKSAPSIGAIPINSIHKVALSYKTGWSACVANGGTIFSAMPDAIPNSISQLQIGALGGGLNNNLPCCVKKIKYWPRCLPDSQLQLITA